MAKKLVIKVNNPDFDYDKLAEAIVKAQQKAEEQKEIERQQEEEKLREETISIRREILKDKDYSNTKNRFLRRIKTLINQVLVVFRILFIPKKKIKFFSAIDGLISSFTIGLLFVVRIILYVFSILFVSIAFRGGDITFSILIAFSIFVVAQFIRIAQYEVERLKDRDYVLALFVGILTVFSIVVSIITLFPDGDIMDIKQVLIEIKNFLLTQQ